MDFHAFATALYALVAVLVDQGELFDHEFILFWALASLVVLINQECQASKLLLVKLVVVCLAHTISLCLKKL